jgi:hypothetical protein
VVKEFLNAVFTKKPIKKVIEPSVPAFKITQTELIKSDFEVSEISYEEYAKFKSNERRYTARPVVYDRRNPTGLSRA